MTLLPSVMFAKMLSVANAMKEPNGVINLGLLPTGKGPGLIKGEWKRIVLGQNYNAWLLLIPLSHVSMSILCPHFGVFVLAKVEGSRLYHRLSRVAFFSLISPSILRIGPWPQSQLGGNEDRILTETQLARRKGKWPRGLDLGISEGSQDRWWMPRSRQVRE